MIFEGSAVALATPFTSTGINFETLGQLIDFQIQEGTDAVLVCGTTGEPATMSSDERRAVTEFTVSRVGGRIPVIVGVGGNNTAAAAAEARQARISGADAVLAVTPYYNRCTDAGLVAHFCEIAEAAELPVIVYNVPSRTSVNISPETLIDICRHPGIAAVKEASGNISQVAEIARTSGERLDIYSGNDDHIVPFLSLGALGVISVLANIMPAFVHELVASYRQGETDKALRMQLYVNGLVHALFSEVNPIPVKTALNMMGFDMGDLRLPLTRMQPKNERMLRECMDMHGLLAEEHYSC